MLMGNYTFLAIAQQRLLSDCRMFGIVFDSTSLVQFQMGLIPEVRLFYGMWSLKALSRPKSSVTCQPSPKVSDSVHLWHSSLSRDGRGISYFCPSLIRKGVVTMGSLHGNPEYLSFIGTAWQSKHQLAMNDRANKVGVKMDCVNLAFISAKSQWAGVVSSGVSIYPSLDVEGKPFFSKTLPPALHLFLMEVFHLQLCVRGRMVSFVHADKCPICGQVGTVFHAIVECKHRQLISDLITGSFALVPYKGSRCSIFETPLVCRLNYSLGV